MSRFGNLELGGSSEQEFQGTGRVNKDGRYYLTEARAAFESGHFENALRAYSKVLEFDPRNPVAWTGQVQVLIELGEFHEAKLWADKALERFPHEPELLAAKAVALGRLGDLDAALAFSDAAAEERGDTPYIWLARADVMLARQEARADYCFEKALGLAPGDWFIHWLAARVHYFYQQFAQALRLAQQALAWNAGATVLWLLAGLCQRELGLIGQAEMSLAQARQLDPHSAEVREASVSLSKVGVGRRMAAACRNLFRR